jgi:hypothetical protein
VISPSQEIYLKTHNTRKRSMHPAGFQPAISASEWAQTHSLYRSATEINPYDSFRIFPKLSLNRWLFMVN